MYMFQLYSPNSCVPQKSLNPIAFAMIGAASGRVSPVSVTCAPLLLLLLLTNQFTGAWTHYTDTVQGARTDHMVEGFQRISIE